jgi:hypothetical protein
MQQQYPRHDAMNPAPSERQEFHNSSCAMGVATHVLKMAGILSPLLILEFVKEPAKASRWIRIASVVTAGVTETLWATKARRSSPEERHR